MGMSVRELRGMMAARGLATDGLIEKSDFVDALISSTSSTAITTGPTREVVMMPPCRTSE